MVIKTTRVINQIGLHAREVTKFVDIANKFECVILVEKQNDNGRVVNAKSLLGMLSLDIKHQDEIKIMAHSGNDCEAAVEKLVKFIEKTEEE